MILPRLIYTIAAALGMLSHHSVFAAAGYVKSDSSNIMGVAGQARATAVQGNSRVVIGGTFSSLAGTARNNLTGCNSAGTVTYTPSGTAGTAIIHIALQDDDVAGGSPLTFAVQTFTITLTDNTAPPRRHHDTSPPALPWVPPLC